MLFEIVRREKVHHLNNERGLDCDSADQANPSELLPPDHDWASLGFPMIVNDLKKYGPGVSSHAPVPGGGERLLPATCEEPLREFHGGELVSPPGAQAAFLQCLCLLPVGRTIWRMKRAIPSQSIALLDWWGTLLADECYAGRATHPVFVALSETIRDFSIPQQPFSDLLVAFRRDQQPTEYETKESPVGLLSLFGEPGRTDRAVSGTGVTTRNWDGFPIRFAPDCNWSISGKTSREIGKSAGCIFLWPIVAVSDMMTPCFRIRSKMERFVV